jgi:hypothetical protein
MSQWRARAVELLPDLRAEIQRAGSPSELWCELWSRFRQCYEEQNGSAEMIRSIYLYAIWCTRASSFKVREAAWIGFYEDVGAYAFQCNKSVYPRVVEDLVVNLGIPEIETLKNCLGHLIKPEQVYKLIADAREVDHRLRRRSQKRRR